MDDNFDLAPGRWATLRRLLGEALSLDSQAREQWLQSLDPSLAAFGPRLRRLLAHEHDAQAQALLQTLPRVETGDFAPLPAELADARIGPYRLLRELGSGGMASVWLAERTDMLQGRRVALKLPHGAWRRAGLVERMAREREILATLNHPHIASLHDAGVTDDGQPYLALEYVEGERIDLYCNARSLDVPARLRLFLQVVRAVSYAHGKLVVHRDLKPSNILVTPAGNVKLLDFGIAKVLAEDRADETALTQQSGRALTPDYAAPEQIRGEALGTAADLYSLGVVLFELLAGERPYQLKRESRAALEDAILQAQVRRPSDVATQPRLKKRLRGDLDTIVLKALKPSPADRYGTAQALAEDIERHLRRQPVSARPDGGLYRLRRFIARNAPAVGAAGVVGLALVAGTGLALWQARVANAERQRAEDVKDFIATVFRQANLYEGTGTDKELTAADLLKQADKKLEAAKLGHAGSRVELSNMIGEGLMAIGQVAAAEPAIVRAIEQAQRELGPAHFQTVRGLLLRSQVHRFAGRPQEARKDLDLALPVLRQHAAADPAAAVQLVTGLLHSGLTSVDLGAYAEAEQAAQEAVQVATARLGEQDPVAVASAVLLSLAYRYNKKFDLARDSGERALRLAEAVHGTQAPHPRVNEARTIYARALADTGDLARGISMLELAAQNARALYGSKGQMVGIVLQNLVDYQIDLGELDAARSNAQTASEILSAYLPEGSMGLGLTQSTRANVHLARRDAHLALEGAAQAAAVFDKLVGPRHEANLAVRITATAALMWQGRLDEAKERADAVAAGMEGLPAAHVQRARVAVVRGTLDRLRGDMPSALRHLQAVADSTETAPKWQRERMRAMAQIGLIQLDQGEPARAAVTLLHALSEFDRLEARTTPARADAMLGLGRAHLALGRPALAIPFIQAADVYWRDHGPPGPWAREAVAAAARLRDRAPSSAVLATAARR